MPQEEWETLWVSQGMPGGRTSPRAEMVEGFNSGWIHFGVPGAERVAGATDIKAVIEELVSKAS